MTSLAVILLLVTLGIYSPGQWNFYPAMTEVVTVAVSPGEVYVAVPAGVYILDGRTLAYRRCLTFADGFGARMMVCAWNAARSELLVASIEGLYSFLPQTGLTQRLHPPFERVSSIGTSRSGAWLETNRGLFRKHLTLDQYERIDSVPPDVQWKGALDAASARDFVFLTPYFYTDEQLTKYSLGSVARDSRRHRLLVAALGFGLLQYDLRTGLLEQRITLGPIGPVRRIEGDGNSLWLIGNEHLTVLDSANRWHSYLLGAGRALPPSLSRRLVEVAGSVTGINDLVERDGTNYFATDLGLVAVDSSGRSRNVLRTSRPLRSLLWLGDSLLVGTADGLYLSAADSLLRLSEPTGRTDWGVYGMAVAADGSLWLATLGGLVTRRATGEWLRLTPPGVDLSAPVQAVAVDGRRLFFALAAGVGAYDLGSGGWTFWDQTHGVPPGPVNAMRVADGRLWLATPGMVSAFDYSATLPVPDR